MKRGRLCNHIVTAEQAGTRLDIVLSAALTGLSRSFIKRLLDDGRVLVEGSKEKAGYRVKEGQHLTVEVPLEPALGEPEDIPLSIVYEDCSLLVVNKAPGMVVHPAAGNFTGTLVNALLFHIKDLSGIGGVERPGIVHRLDKDTSGLMVVAKNDASHISLSGQLAKRTIKREYLAIAHGAFEQQTGTVSAPIARHAVHRKRMAVRPDGRHAVTHYSVLEDFRRYSFIQLKLETGRTHQIRVHMAHIGHPLVGDILYGGGGGPLPAVRQMLHAYKLSFVHPDTKEPVHFEVDPPADFREVLQRLRTLY